MKLKRVLSFGFAFCLLTACGKGREVDVNGRDPDPNSNNPAGKTKTDVPPQFNPDQLKVGNFIVWEVNNGTSQYCLKWTVQKVSPADLLAQIKINRSADCSTYSDGKYEYFIFGTDDGRVLEHMQVIQGGEPKDVAAADSYKQKKFNVYQIFYRIPDKVPFTIGTEKFTEKFKLPVFRLNNGESVFYKGDDQDPKHPWHGVMLKLKDSSKPPNILTYKAAFPALIGTPDKP